jgi:hypothetical protein
LNPSIDCYYRLEVFEFNMFIELVDNSPEGLSLSAWGDSSILPDAGLRANFAA